MSSTQSRVVIESPTDIEEALGAQAERVLSPSWFKEIAAPLLGREVDLDSLQYPIIRTYSNAGLLRSYFKLVKKANNEPNPDAAAIHKSYADTINGSLSWLF